MVDRYWCEVESVKDNIENSLKISGILLKLKEYDEKINDLENNEDSISSNF